MRQNLRKVDEERRKKLINILKYSEFRSEEELLDLSLNELEIEYTKLQSESHPHCEMGSIHWKNKKVSGHQNDHKSF